MVLTFPLARDGSGNKESLNSASSVSSVSSAVQTTTYGISVIRDSDKYRNLILSSFDKNTKFLTDGIRDFLRKQLIINTSYGILFSTVLRRGHTIKTLLLETVHKIKLPANIAALLTPP